MSRVHTITIPGRPRSTKNSRRIIQTRGRTRSVMSEAASCWMTQARADVRRAWKGRPLQTPAHVHIHLVLSNRRSLMDADNATSGIFDALKGLVVVDDSLLHIPSFSFSHEIAPGTPECVVVTLTQVQR